jgi:hypothetical protein
VVSGIGLSTCGMALAAAGWLVPVAGAIFQEADLLLGEEFRNSSGGGSCFDQRRDRLRIAM